MPSPLARAPPHRQCHPKGWSSTWTIRFSPYIPDHSRTQIIYCHPSLSTDPYTKQQAFERLHTNIIHGPPPRCHQHSRRPSAPLHYVGCELTTSYSHIYTRNEILLADPATLLLYLILCLIQICQFCISLIFQGRPLVFGGHCASERSCFSYKAKKTACKELSKEETEGKGLVGDEQRVR